MTLYLLLKKKQSREDKGKVMYDIDTDTSYNAWLRLQHTFTSQKQLNTNVTGRHYPVNLLKPTGTLAIKSFSSAKVITSKENQKRL